MLCMLMLFSASEMWATELTVDVKCEPTGVAKVYAKYETEEEYTENQETAFSPQNSGNFSLKYDNLQEGYTFLGWSKGAPSTNASDMVSTDQVATVTVLSSEPTVTYYANFSGGSGSNFTVTEDGSISEHGTVTYKVNGTETAPVSGVINAKENDEITLIVTPNTGWIVDVDNVKAESYTTWDAAGARRRSAPDNIQILGDVTLTKSTTAENTWTFTMPAASVLVSAGYIKSSTLYFDPADKTNLVKVTVDGTDRNLNGSKTVKIKRVDNVLEGTAVSLKANDGYKFRKVQVTKTDDGLKLTNPTVGQVIGSDGKNYAYASLPTGVTAVAKICYVSGNSGLALALTDESTTMDWATAIETCAAHTPAFKGAEWKLASQDEWNNMKNAAGSYANLRNGFSSVGGTDMRSLQEETYWSSTEQVNSQNAWYMLNSGNWYRHDKSVTKYVRACLAF